MLLLMAAVYATIELKGNFPKGSETRELVDVHTDAVDLFPEPSHVVLEIFGRVVHSISPPSWQAIGKGVDCPPHDLCGSQVCSLGDLTDNFPLLSVETQR